MTPGNPLKEASLYAAYEKRCARALKIADHPKIKINTYEARKGLTYSDDTISALKQDYPGDNFVWLMGADSAQTFHLWRNWEGILQKIPIAIFNRPDYEMGNTEIAKKYVKNNIPFEKARSLTLATPPAWSFIPYPDNSISSTQIRAQKKKKKTVTKMALSEDKNEKKTNNMLPKDHSVLKHFLDFKPAQGDFAADVLAGLDLEQKSLSPKYFYDEKGSQLFSKITLTKDYYPTRTELALMTENIENIKVALGEAPAIFEYGSGTSKKIRLLIEKLEGMTTYTAMDISRDFLLKSAMTLASDYPALEVSAVCGDFQSEIILPDDFHPEIKSWTGYFPGSTIGNFPPGTVKAFLKRVSNTLGDNAKFLMGFDLIKDKTILDRAYNDDEGVTAAFNLNLLTRMKRELGAQLSRKDFDHYAFYNSEQCRIEMHLRANKPTKIIIGEHEFSFAQDETLLTEYSYKYTKESMEEMIEGTPWTMSHYWTDKRQWFATCLLRNS